MWRGLIVRCRSFRPSHERQRKMDISLANNPNSKFAAGAVAEVLKACNVSEAQLRRKAFHFFFFQCFCEHLVSTDHLSEKSCSLLPFSFFRYVSVVTSSEREYGQQVGLVVEVSSQPRPCGKISGRKLRKGSGPELGVLPEKRRNLHSVHVTDRTQAASPGITVAVGR